VIKSNLERILTYNLLNTVYGLLFSTGFFVRELQASGYKLQAFSKFNTICLKPAGWTSHPNRITRGGITLQCHFNTRQDPQTPSA
jgi:hypothetical protein